MTESSTSTSTSPELMQEILDIVAKEAMIDRGDLAPETLLEELEIESADYVMILMAVEERFGVYISIDSGFTDARTVGDLVDVLAARIAENAGGGAV